MPNFVKESMKLNCWELEGVGIFSGTTRSQSYLASYPKIIWMHEGNEFCNPKTPYNVSILDTK